MSVSVSMQDWRVVSEAAGRSGASCLSVGASSGSSGNAVLLREWLGRDADGPSFTPHVVREHGSVVGLVSGGRRHGAIAGAGLGVRSLGLAEETSLVLVSSAAWMPQSERWSWSPVHPGSMQFGVALFDHVLVGGVFAEETNGV